jgi:hypothetical protein
MFSNFNRLLSKFTHPTAISVFATKEEFEVSLKKNFYDAGVACGNNALSILSSVAH